VEACGGVGRVLRKDDETVRLNLGCSTDLRGGEWMNVDIAPPDYDPILERTPQFELADLARPWPWEDSSVDEIYAADIFEHIGDIPRLDCYERGPMGGRHWSGRIHVMNESWRVLKPGGILTMECPDAAKGCGQWQDPTHVTPWTPNGLQYFRQGTPAYKRFAKAYGITARFNVLSVNERKYEEMVCGVRCEVWKFTAVMEAIKP
jgi:predicted SAM-dependent methyltransferase